VRAEDLVAAVNQGSIADALREAVEAEGGAFAQGGGSSLVSRIPWAAYAGRDVQRRDQTTEHREGLMGLYVSSTPPSAWKECGAGSGFWYGLREQAGLCKQAPPITQQDRRFVFHMASDVDQRAVTVKVVPLTGQGGWPQSWSLTAQPMCNALNKRYMDKGRRIWVVPLVGQARGMRLGIGPNAKRALLTVLPGVAHLALTPRAIEHIVTTGGLLGAELIWSANWGVAWSGADLVSCVSGDQHSEAKWW
jgi:hypothetical protein